MFDRRPFATFLLLVAGCSDGLNVPPEPYAVRQVYSPATGEIPLPNDLLFSGTLDATLNFPASSDPAQQPLFDALNSLDGWSTSAPLSFRFDGAVDPATVVAGDSVRLFEVALMTDPATGLTLGQPVTGIVRELTSPAEYIVAPAPSDPTNGTYAVLPTAPLAPTTSYLLVVTDAVHDEEGEPVGPGGSYELARTDVVANPFPPDHPFVGLQLLINAMETVVSTDVGVAPPIAREEIVVTLTFTTQSLFEVHDALEAVARGNEANVLAGICAASPSAAHLACGAAPANTVPSASVDGFLGDTAALVPGSMGHADVYAVSLTLPYYLLAAANPGGGLVSDPAPLGGRWTARFGFLEGTGAFDPMDTDRHVTRYNPLPLQTGPEIVPMLVSLPNAMSGQVQPGTGWPVAIFVHGVTQNRANLLAIADRLADEGFAAVAIDLPLHGIVDSGSPLHVGTQDGLPRERTFGLDLVTQDGSGAITADVPDGTADSSGLHYINPASLETQRDNLRQSIADLFAVEKALTDNLNVDGSAVIVADDFDPSRMHVVGQSLGANVAAMFYAVDDGVVLSAALSVPGGGLPRMLEASPTFGPTLIAALADAGIDQGTPEFDAYVFAFQTTIDSGDPINYCPGLGLAGKPVFLQEVVGGGPGGGLPDQTIPNSVAGAPLSGTDPMIASLGLTVVNTTTATGLGATRFQEGVHGSLLLPDPAMDMDPANLAAFLEMQNQVADWLTSIATTPTVTITDGSVIVP